MRLADVRAHFAELGAQLSRVCAQVNGAALCEEVVRILDQVEAFDDSALLSLAQAAEYLAESDALRRAMGEYFHDRLVAVRRAETEAVAGLDEEALVAKYRWRF